MHFLDAGPPHHERGASLFSSHNKQVQRCRLLDPEAGQAAVHLPAVMGLMIEPMHQRLPSWLAGRGASCTHTRIEICPDMPPIVADTGVLDFACHPDRIEVCE